MSVFRIYVEKKPEFAIKAKDLKHEIKHYLNIQTVTNVRELIRYDVENISDETYEKACKVVFAEPPVDICYQEDFPRAEGARVFSVEFLPGQFDQRADSAEQCVKLLNEDEDPIIKTATTYILSGNVTDEQLKAVMEYCINPVDSRACGMEIPETLVTEYEEPADVIVFDGFKDMAEDKLKELYDSLGLAMTFKDFLHIQKYFKGEEKRDPSMTEIRVLDTYWSDHCRHTTFSTELTNVEFDDGDYKDMLEKTFDAYRAEMKEMYKDRDDKFICLMDIALMGMKQLKAAGKLDDMEVSDEINAGTYRPKDSELPEGQLTGEDVVTADSITEDQVVDYILAKHPNITGCFAANGDSVKLAVDGLERNKMEKKVKVIGFDANDDEIQDLKDGKVNGLIVQNPFGMGYATVVAAARASLNMGNEAVVNTGYTWVTKKNLKTDEVQKILYSK